MPPKKRPRKHSVTSARSRQSERRLNRSVLEKKLLTLLYEKAFRFSRQPIFRLASGRSSPYYIDCKKVTLDPYGAYLIGRIIFERVKKLKPHGIGGMTLGADPIAQAVSIISHIKHHPIPAFVVRKEPKGYGSASGGSSLSGGWIEGSLPRKSRVIVVEDVVTTGGSTLKAIEPLVLHGCKIIKVIGLVDRHEGGKEAITSRGYSLETLFSIKDLLGLAPSKKPRTGVEGFARLAPSRKGPHQTHGKKRSRKPAMRNRP